MWALNRRGRQNGQQGNWVTFYQNTEQATLEPSAPHHPTRTSIHPNIQARREFKYSLGGWEVKKTNENSRTLFSIFNCKVYDRCNSYNIAACQDVRSNHILAPAGYYQPIIGARGYGRDWDPSQYCRKKHCHRHYRHQGIEYSFNTFSSKQKLEQSRTLGQISAWFCLAKDEKYIEQFWQIHVAALTNPCSNSEKSM